MQLFCFLRKREVKGERVEVREEELKMELREDFGLASSPTAVRLEERDVRFSGKAEPWLRVKSVVLPAIVSDLERRVHLKRRGLIEVYR